MVLRHAKKKMAWNFAGLYNFKGLHCNWIKCSILSGAISERCPAAGYAFGGVWLSLNIVLLEVLRLLLEIQHNKC